MYSVSVNRGIFHHSPLAGLLLGLAASALTFLLPISPLHADGGSVLFEQTSGPFRITVLTSPARPPAGPADISVLVQDAQSLAPVLDAIVTLALAPPSTPPAGTEAWLPPCCSMKNNADLAALPATRSGAHNRLLYAATPQLPTAGDWSLTVTVSRNAQSAAVSGTLAVGPPPSPISTRWPFLALAPAAIGLFCLHQHLRKR